MPGSLSSGGPVEEASEKGTEGPQATTLTHQQLGSSTWELARCHSHLPSPILTQQEGTRPSSPPRLLFHTPCGNETSRELRAIEPGLLRMGSDPLPFRSCPRVKSNKTTCHPQNTGGDVLEEKASPALTSVAMTHSFLSSDIKHTDWYMESLGEHIAAIRHSGFSLREHKTG